MIVAVILTMCFLSIISFVILFCSFASFVGSLKNEKIEDAKTEFFIFFSSILVFALSLSTFLSMMDMENKIKFYERNLSSFEETYEFHSMKEEMEKKKEGAEK